MPGLFYFRLLMHHYLSYNGCFLEDDTPLISANSRAFRYGDGLFETMKLADGKILFPDYHMERLFKGLELLGFDLPSYFTASSVIKQVTDLCHKNNYPVARVRLTIFRGDGGVFDPENHSPNCIIQSWPLSKPGFELNENGLVIGIYEDAQKSPDIFANLKTNNYLPYLLAGLETKKQRWNEALILNTRAEICDATTANIFIVKEGIVYTPALTGGCIAGTIRRFLLERMPAAGFDAREATLTVNDINEADEIFLTNAIHGIRWVQRCGNTEYGNQFTTTVYNSLLKNFY